MWRFYRCTRKDEDNTNYKEALNAATRMKLENLKEDIQKIASNIKNDIENCYAYVRSKQNVQIKVGPLVLEI